MCHVSAEAIRSFFLGERFFRFAAAGGRGRRLREKYDLIKTLFGDEAKVGAEEAVRL